MKNTGSYCSLSINKISLKSLKDKTRTISNRLPLNDLHTTLICDQNKKFNLNNNKISIKSQVTNVVIWGNDSQKKIILILDDKLVKYHEKICKENHLDHYIQPYIPHITLSYDANIKELTSSLKNKLIGTIIEFDKVITKDSYITWKDKFIRS